MVPKPRFCRTVVPRPLHRGTGPLQSITCLTPIRKKKLSHGCASPWLLNFVCCRIIFQHKFYSFFFLTYKNMCQFTCTEHNSEVHGSLVNCVPTAWNLHHVTLLTPRILRWFLDISKIGCSWIRLIKFSSLYCSCNPLRFRTLML